MTIPKIYFPDSDLSYKPEEKKLKSIALETTEKNRIFENGNFNYLRSCRLQVQNPENCEITSYYITRTDKNRFRVKVFRGGKCLKAEYVKAESFAEILLNTKF